MAKKKSTSKKDAKRLSNVSDYRHASEKRKNNPPAKIAAEGHVPLVPKAVYHYSPRRPPSLRFDVAGQPDQLPQLLAEATRRPLSPDEAQQLAAALRAQEPWLEWAGKLEQERRGGFSVDPVVLHIHERINTAPQRSASWSGRSTVR